VSQLNTVALVGEHRPELVSYLTSKMTEVISVSETSFILDPLFYSKINLIVIHYKQDISLKTAFVKQLKEANSPLLMLHDSEQGAKDFILYMNRLVHSYPTSYDFAKIESFILLVLNIESKNIEQVSQLITRNSEISLATGILMSKASLSRESAFDQIRRDSRNRRICINKIANEIIEAHNYLTIDER